MPYTTIQDLPDNVKDHLPMHGQEIYRAAFNKAFEKYLDEKTAFKVAWSAVKKLYFKDQNDNWVSKQEENL